MDRCDIRPRTIPPGGTPPIFLGCAARELLQPRPELPAITDAGLEDLSAAPPG